ncbi:MAG: AEC family transporter [Treponemataceae bacterium]|nr:AEC family transporter [Treponemataceae bacterium]
MIGVGFLCTKKKVFTETAIESISRFCLYVVTPCVIIESFNRPFDSSMLKGLGITFISAVGIHAMNIAIAHLTIHDPDEARRRVLRFEIVFSNCGFMALPLQQALIGADGVFYGAAYIAVFNLFAWTYGYFQMAGAAVPFNIKKILLNPGILAVFAGLILFLSPATLPDLISSPVSSLAALNTPLPMVVIGFYLATGSTLSILKDKGFLYAMCMRLIISPLISLMILRYLCGLTGNVLYAVTIASSAPAAANTVMFSVMFKRDSQLATALVSISTLFSILTMPLLVSLAMSL